MSGCAYFKSRQVLELTAVKAVTVVTAMTAVTTVKAVTAVKAGLKLIQEL